MTDIAERPPAPESLGAVVIRFAGDSGDGMQLTGDRFTSVSAWLGNDLATLPEFPAEIRAPAGTLAGVSAFQVHISDHDITTPGDAPNVLIAMNPAALRNELHRVEQGGTLIINTDTFDERNLEKAGYAANPLTDESLRGYRVVEVPMTSLTKEATVPLGVKPRDADRSKNFFALGLICWVYSRPVDQVLAWIDERFGSNDLVRTANRAAFQAGWNFGETTEVFDHQYEIKRASLPAGEYTQITGNTALAWGLVAAGQPSQPPGLPGQLPDHPRLGHPARAGQAQELRRAHPAGRGRDRGRRHRAGRGLRRPPRRHHHQRPGPGAEERDHQPGHQPGAAAAHHRHPARRAVHRAPHQDRGGRPQPGPLRAPRRGAAAGRGRLPAVALLRRRHRGRPHRPQVPHAGDPAVRRLHRQRGRAVEAAGRRHAAGHLGALRHGAQPRAAPTARRSSGPTCAIPRRWPGRGPSPARPGSCTASAASRRRTAPATSPTSRRTTSAWSTCERTRWPASPGTSRRSWCEATTTPTCWSWAGARPGPPSTRRCRALARRGTKVAWVHLVHLNPLPPNLGEIVRRYRHVVVPELNLGQLCRLIRAEFLVDAKSITKVQGVPFTALRAGAGLRRRAGRGHGGGAS